MLKACPKQELTSGVASFMGVAPGSPAAAGEMKGGVMMAGVQPGKLPCMRTACPSDKACKQLAICFARHALNTLLVHGVFTARSEATSGKAAFD